MSISFGWNPFATAGLAEQLHEAGDTLGFGEVSDLSEALLIPVFLSGDKEESAAFDGPGNIPVWYGSAIPTWYGCLASFEGPAFPETTLDV